MTSAWVMASTSDLSGLVRGKGFAARDLEAKLIRGIGWTPTNAQITCFDTIAASPYGALGDLVMKPDRDTLVDAPLGEGQQLAFVLSDILDLDGAAWECCTRGLLKTAAARLRDATGLELRASFEHEFMLDGLAVSPGFSLRGFAEIGPFAERLLAALDAAGIAPDSFLREYGPGQFEITMPPKAALRAADDAVILRELTRAVAAASGLAATFSPLTAPDVVGNGVHIHFSFWTADGEPATSASDQPDTLSPEAAGFVAGILAHANGLVALTAPTAISFMRLVPHRWSAGFNNLGRQDREALVRICPVTARERRARARQFNLEYRAADAGSSPHLALAAMIEAGLQGLRRDLPAPKETEEDLSLLAPEELARRGHRRLPADLPAALAALSRDPDFTDGFPGRFLEIYLAHKAGEYEHVAEISEAARLDAYRAVY